MDELEIFGGQLEVCDLPTVRGSKRLLTVAFEHLIANAIKFRSEAPLMVRIDAERIGGDWLIRFADNGIGVKPDQTDRIFRIFQRLHTRSEYAGNGISLTLVRRILEMHGGAISVAGGADCGAVFSITLPTHDHNVRAIYPD